MFVNEEYFRPNSKMTSTGGDYLLFAVSNGIHLLNVSISATTDVLQSTDIRYWLWTLVCSAVKQSKISSQRGNRYICTNAELFNTNSRGCGIWTSLMSQNHPLHTCYCARWWQPFSVALWSMLLWESHNRPVVFQVGISYTDDIAYRPWVRIPASQGWVTLEPHRTLEATFHRGEICDVRQIRTQKGDEPMGKKVIFGTLHQSPRYLCLKLVTESSFCGAEKSTGWRGTDKRRMMKILAREFEWNRRKRRKIVEIKIMVGYWSGKVSLGPCKGPLIFFRAVF